MIADEVKIEGTRLRVRRTSKQGVLSKYSNAQEKNGLQAVRDPDCPVLIEVPPGASNPAAFVAELNAAGSAWIYSTYLGCSYDKTLGDSGSFGSAIAVDSSGNAVVAGTTTAVDFLVANPLQPTIHGVVNAFVRKISSTGSGPWVSLSSLQLPFGAENVNATSPPLTETVTNGGTSALTISGVNVEGANAAHFVLSADACTGATLAPKSTCAMSVTFSPSTPGALTAFLKLSDNAPNSPQTVGLFGVGGGTAPVASVSPTTLAFGGQPIGNEPASLPVTLKNTGGAALTVGNITTSYYFLESDNCVGSAIAAGSSRTINVSISPPSVGPLSGTLTIIDNSNGVEGAAQTVSLTGTGQDFALNVAPGSSATASVAPGQSATYTLSVVGVDGFNQSVSFGCGLVTNATCAISPNPVPIGSSPTNFTVTVTTTAPSGSGPNQG